MHPFRRGRSYKRHLELQRPRLYPDQIDFIAAYIIPTDTWYILPIRATNAQPDILQIPHNTRSKYESTEKPDSRTRGLKLVNLQGR
jgi:hypothetical protein